MELVWRKGPYTWIAALPGKEQSASTHFAAVESPADESMSTLCNRLLVVGGIRVCIFVADEKTCEFFANEGKPIAFTKIEARLSERNECHVNTALLWKKLQADCQIITGYGLSEDGMWRRHSCVLVGDAVLETTEPRTKYFGIRLVGGAAQAFHDLYTASTPPAAK